MKQVLQQITNSSAFVLITLILGAGQVSAWMQVFGYFPPPNSWIPTIIFMVIYRNFKEGLIVTLLLSGAMSTLSAVPVLIFTASNLLVFFLSHMTKHRIFWVGPTYLMFLSAVSSISYPVFHLILSWIWEAAPIVDFQFFSMLIRALLTALTALPLYYLFSFIDSKTNKVLPTESGNLLYE